MTIGGALDGKSKHSRIARIPSATIIGRKASTPNVRISIVPFCLMGHTNDRFGLSSSVGHPVRLRRGGEPIFQRFVFSWDIRVINQIVSEEEPVPMLGKMTLHHVDVVRSRTGAGIPLDEPHIEWRAVIGEGSTLVSALAVLLDAEQMARSRGDPIHLAAERLFAARVLGNMDQFSRLPQVDFVLERIVQVFVDQHQIWPAALV